MGPSRKRFIGEITGDAAPSDRVFGTVGASVAALDRGAMLFRVHDVKPAREALDVAWAVACGIAHEFLEQLRLLHPGWRDALELLDREPRHLPACCC